MCQFSFNDSEKFYHTNANLNKNIIKCFSPLLNNIILPVNNIILSIYHIKTNLTFGYYNLIFINCSNFLSCSSCTSYSNICQWNIKTLNCISQKKEINPIINSNQCPLIYLQQSIHYLTYNIDKTFNIHIEQCNQYLNIISCQLYDHRKRFLITTFNRILIRSNNETNFCLLKCLFQQSNLHQIPFYRSLNLQLSIQYSNKTTAIIPHTHISLYHCEHLALNCTSCLQLNPSYDCIWCNNRCIFKNQSIKCSNKQECLLPIIQKIEPLILPINGGTLVTIKGKYFNLFHLSIDIADIPCQLIEEESSNNK